MLHVITGILIAAWDLMVDMAPYLLFGFLAAGVLNILIPRKKIHQHLAGNNLAAVVKAAIFGVPLPICSCGVIPLAAYIRDKGASKGATISFLSSTPTTGVDSILATYSLLGPIFAVIRPLAALFAGIFGGLLTSKTENSSRTIIKPAKNPCGNGSCVSDPEPRRGPSKKIKKIFTYAFYDLIMDTGKWIVLGIVLGGMITYLIPANFIEKFLGNPWLAYPLMLLISIPMYICATGSIPIAASLILKGMTPGAGLVFLIAGPATNTATLSFTGGKLGKKPLSIYLFSIILTSLIFGLLLDLIWKPLGGQMSLLAGGKQMLPLWLKNVSAVILVFVLLNVFRQKILPWNRNKKAAPPADAVTYSVPDMTCRHCAATIKETLDRIPSISSFAIDLSAKQIRIKGDFDQEQMIQALSKAGFSPKIIL